MKISTVSQLARKKFAKKVPAKKAREKHMLETEKSSAKLHFTSTSRNRPSCEVPTKLFTWKILSVIFLLFTYTDIPSLPTKVKKVFQRENPNKYTWKLEIVIPTIIYTFPCGFPRLLPLHL